jgi:hypothetical protein
MGWYRLLGKGLRDPHRMTVDIQLVRPTFCVMREFDDYQPNTGAVGQSAG